jgi:hypothetical protein
MKIDDLNEDERARVFSIAGSLSMKQINLETDLLHFLTCVYSWSIDARNTMGLAIGTLSDFRHEGCKISTTYLKDKI